MDVRIIKYPRYAQYERQRIETNDTVMALLAGSKLASQTLGLTEGSELVLSQIFPRVEHIERFDLRTDRARGVLDNAEELLGVLAVPQILALHEDLLRGMLQLFHDDNPGSVDLADGAKAANVHERMESVTPARFTVESVELFHLIRVARNSHIHSGGRADQPLVNRLAATSSAALSAWDRITGVQFRGYQLGEPVVLGLNELVGTLALTKWLAEEANVTLQGLLSRSAWADLVVEDALARGGAGNFAQRRRRIAGLARTSYAPLGLTTTELVDAAGRAGII